MLQSSHAGEIVRSALLLTACLVLAPELWILSAQDVPQIAGTWRGDSVCAVPNTPCRNEVNVYRFSEIPGKANRFSCTAAKIVGGKEIVMGRDEWTYDVAKHMLQTVAPNPTIRLVLNHDILDGALVLPDSTIYRRIHLKKSTD